MRQATVSVIGAGGKMGSRIVNNLLKSSEYRLLCCEKSDTGVARLHAAGAAVAPLADAVSRGDVVILAVPDARMAEVSREVDAHLRPGTTVLLLDPAAPTAGEVTLRDGVNYVVTHPCHPPLFGDETTPEARRDFFGGIAAKQDIVVALMRGTEEAFAAAEKVCRAIFAPVVNAHRITVEQMAILEPAMAEVVAASAAVLMKEALEMAVAKGVPRAAATAFMMGHAQIPLAIVFGAIGSPFSDAAKIAIRYGQKHLYKDDWRKVFEPEHVRACIQEMLHP